MAFTSQLGTNESILADTMAMGEPVELGDPKALDVLVLTEDAFDGHKATLFDAFANTDEASMTLAQAVSCADTLTLTDSTFTDLARAADTLTVTDAAVGGGDFNLDLADALALTEQADHGYEAFDTLTLTDSADIPAEAFDTLVLTDEVEAAESLKDAFTPGETVGLVVDYRVSPSDTLTLTEAAVSTMDMLVGGSDELESTEEVFDPETFTFDTIDTGLRDSATSGGPLPESVQDILALSESALAWTLIPGGFSDDASDLLSLTERADFAITLNASDTLSVSDAATGDVSAAASDSLSLSDEAISAQTIAEATASDTLSLTESLSFIADDAQLQCKYSPFIGEGPGDAPPASYTAAGGTPGFRLQFPETGAVTDEVEVRDPNFDNKDRLSFSRVNHETRGGTLIIFADPTWPKIETQVFSFSGLKKAKAEELQTFMFDHLGVEIRLIDHEDRLWRGVITDVQQPKVQDNREQFTMSFEFEGEKV